MKRRMTVEIYQELEQKLKADGWNDISWQKGTYPAFGPGDNYSLRKSNGESAEILVRDREASAPECLDSFEVVYINPQTGEESPYLLK